MNTDTDFILDWLHKAFNFVFSFLNAIGSVQRQGLHYQATRAVPLHSCRLLRMLRWTEVKDGAAETLGLEASQEA